MKHLALLALPLLLSACAVVQMPARLINSVISPLLGSNETGTAADPQIGIALKNAQVPARK